MISILAVHCFLRSILRCGPLDEWFQFMQEMFLPSKKTGLIINSMEGREAKHQAVARYATNSTYHNRWYSVFRHEFISLIWLRKRGYNLTNSKSCNASYIPKRVSSDEYCYCGLLLTEGVCKYCNHANRVELLKSIKSKKASMELKL